MDPTLTRYLLRDLPEKEMEALDERSIIDEDFAEQVRAAEHDLADAYARGELSPDDRAKWERGLGNLKEGWEQIRLARALQLREDAARPEVSRTARVPERLALAAAAAIALAAAAFYVVRSGREIDRPPASAQSVPGPAPGATAPAPSFVAVTLQIPTRTASEPPVLVIPAGTQHARITLRLEPSEFTKFSLALQDMGTKRVVWRASNVLAETGPDGRTLTVEVPANVLRAGRALFQVMGAIDGGSELVGMYPLTVQR